MLCRRRGSRDKYHQEQREYSILRACVLVYTTGKWPTLLLRAVVPGVYLLVYTHRDLLRQGAHYCCMVSYQ